MREQHQSEFHTGRGGQGNIHKDKYGGHSSSKEQEHAGESVKDKVKRNLGMGGGDKKKEGE